MSKRLDHEKAAKLARLRVAGGESIERADQTFSAGGYPSAREMARGPARSLRPGIDLPPDQYRQESVAKAREAILQGEADKTKLKAELREKRRAIVEDNKRRSKVSNVEHLSRRLKPGEVGPATVLQKFQRGKTREVVVESRSLPSRKPKTVGRKP